MSAVIICNKYVVKPKLGYIFDTHLLKIAQVQDDTASTLAKIAMTYVMASKQCHYGVLFVWKVTPFPCSVFIEVALTKGIEGSVQV